MEDFTVFGLKPQGKSAPMIAARRPPPPPPSAATSVWSTAPAFSNSYADDHDDIFGQSGKRQQNSSPVAAYDDIFSAPQMKNSKSTFSGIDPVFQGFNDSASSAAASSPPSSVPVYDKPVYDEDIFDGVQGMRSSIADNYDDVFNTMSSSTSPVNAMPDMDPLVGDDLIPGFGVRSGESRGRADAVPNVSDGGGGGLDDLIPGFGVSQPATARENKSENKRSHASVSAKPPPIAPDDPFVILESIPSQSSSTMFSDPLDPLENVVPPVKPAVVKSDPSANGGLFGDDFDGLPKAMPKYSSEKGHGTSREQQQGDTTEPASRETSSDENFARKSSDSKVNDRYADSYGTGFDVPAGLFGSNRPSSKGSEGVDAKTFNSKPQRSTSPTSKDDLSGFEDIWLTVDEIPILTQPTSAPPPSRPPPPLPTKRTSMYDGSFSSSFDGKRLERENSTFSSSAHQHLKSSAPNAGKGSGVSAVDELEDFAMGRYRAANDESVDTFSGEEDMEANSLAAASAANMKEVMERAEAKMKQAKEAREKKREQRSVRTRETIRPDRDENDAEGYDSPEKEEEPSLESELKEREDKERERKRLERERDIERERLKEREKEKERQAVERAHREVRERAAAEAREKQAAEARQRAERAAVDKALNEARERAKEKSAAEAKAAAEARDKLEKAREKAASEAREKQEREARERAAVDRATADARMRAERAAVERAYNEARGRAAAAAAAKERLQKSENDLESFFGRPNSTSREKSPSTESSFSSQVQNRVPDVRQTSTSVHSSMRKANSATNMVDDLTSLFGGVPSSGEFQEREGENEERRRARLERHQRTQDRAAKALAEKNERDVQSMRDQAERHRFAEALDPEIKRWAAGKEGNLRALLSTLQYILWPESGWQPVGLTDLITGASVKKVYRKATLCVHPDKVQQKGATVQQKYIAEKVFDLLKEAWNKFNSEELF